MTIQYKANSLCLSRDWEGKSFSATPASTRQSHKIILAIISGVSHYVPRITFIDPGSRRDASPTQISPKDRSHGTWLLKISIFQIAKPRSRATSCVESVDFSLIDHSYRLSRHNTARKMYRRQMFATNISQRSGGFFSKKRFSPANDESILSGD